MVGFPLDPTIGIGHIEGTRMARTYFYFVREGNVPLRLRDVLVYTNADRWEPMSSSYAPNSGISHLVVVNPDFDSAPELKCVVEMDIDPVLVNENKYASDGASLLFNVNGSSLHINIHKNGSMDSTGIYGSDSHAVNWSIKQLGSVGTASIITCAGR